MRPIVANMHEAKSTLSKLVDRAERGDTVFIARDGEPAVLLVPVRPTRRPGWGAFAGAIVLADDFNTPLAEIADDFAGE